MPRKWRRLYLSGASGGWAAVRSPHEPDVVGWWSRQPQGSLSSLSESPSAMRLLLLLVVCCALLVPHATARPPHRSLLVTPHRKSPQVP
ncbi:hypothetical protein E2C01_094614 [Portunus trituberculatus]|uniref:Uncharacterized protein n=1 Tax=Portunus trituberculatus TaxID=210409 RepID=A0A5B7K3M4_PORTR|nr:hypothetical protein [Portunus trituberculatus]